MCLLHIGALQAQNNGLFEPNLFCGGNNALSNHVTLREGVVGVGVGEGLGQVRCGGGLQSAQVCVRRGSMVGPLHTAPPPHPSKKQKQQQTSHTHPHNAPENVN